MDASYAEYLNNKFNINPKITEYVKSIESRLIEDFTKADKIAEINQLKVLKAFQDNNINATHFNWSSGYGYDDAGREAVEKVYASVFNTKSALVRPNIVNGTHAISICLLGLLSSGDEFIEISGAPYDTLQTVIGMDPKEGKGTIIDYGIIYKEVPLTIDKHLDFDKISASITANTKMVAIQRSTGYDFRPAIALDEIKKACDLVHGIDPSIIIMLDNCYGEFVCIDEPTDLGVDIMAGSLIKNPGGGLALSGGYIVGKKELVELISYRLTCPGIGSDCGLTYGQNRNILQGLFIAPKVVNSALKAAMLTGKVYESLGYEVMPSFGMPRSDIIQAIKFNNQDIMLSFCNSIQSASPIDSYVSNEPWDMPGYTDKVVMASGSFVQGSSIELSSDAPLREPYIAYFQGGLTYEHALFGIIKSLDDLYKKSFIKLL